MEKELQHIVDLMISNYRETKQVLRFDGELINQFTSLLYTSKNIKVNENNIKEVRTYINKNTKWYSSFRGNNLYIMSVLLSLENGQWFEKYIEISKLEKRLKEEGFHESPYLSLAAWVLLSYNNKKYRQIKIDEMKFIYSALERNYPNVTSADDYVLCSMLATIGVNKESFEGEIREIFSDIEKKQVTSSNGAQTLANIIYIESLYREEVKNRAYEIIDRLNLRGEKLKPQYIALVGTAAIMIPFTGEFIKNVSDIIKYLSSVEEYDSYIDKSFRLMIAMTIALYYRCEGNIDFINLVVALCINYEIISQQENLMSSIK